MSSVFGTISTLAPAPTESFRAWCGRVETKAVFKAAFDEIRRCRSRGAMHDLQRGVDSPMDEFRGKLLGHLMLLHGSDWEPKGDTFESWPAEQHGEIVLAFVFVLERARTLKDPNNVCAWLPWMFGA